MQPDVGSTRRPGRAEVLGDLRGPDRLAADPDAPGKIDTGSESGLSGDRLKSGDPGQRVTPTIHAAQNVFALVHLPKGAEIPGQAVTNGLQDVGDGGGQRGQYRQRLRDRMLRQ